jgi:hypothetical protein
MKIIDALKTTTGLAAARKREVARLLMKLWQAKDEPTLLKGLVDLGITVEHSRYHEILKIWRDAR